MLSRSASEGESEIVTFTDRELPEAKVMLPVKMRETDRRTALRAPAGGTCAAASGNSVPPAK